MFKFRSDAEEIMDDLNFGDEVVFQTLRELELINRWLGGNAVTLDALEKVFKERNSSLTNAKIRIADLGCGGGDMLKHILLWGKKKKLNLDITGIDANPHIIDFARRNMVAFPELNFAQLDILSKEFRNCHFDIVTATLFFHHFSDEQLIDILSNLKQNVSTAIIINDIHRHWFAYYSIKWLTELFSKSYMVRYDAKLSVLRAFLKNELESVIRRSGYTDFSINWKWAFRYQVILYP